MDVYVSEAERYAESIKGESIGALQLLAIDQEAEVLILEQSSKILLDMKTRTQVDVTALTEKRRKLLEEFA